MRYASRRDQIVANIQVEGDMLCWIWQRYVNPSTGYGQVTIKPDPRRTATAHVVAWEAFVGQVPDGLELDHLCGVRTCCNPGHLEPVPHLLNIRRGSAPRVLLSIANLCAKGHDLTVTAIKNGRTRRCGVCYREWRRNNSGVTTP